MALKDNPLTATEITSAGGTLGYTYSDTNQTGGMSYHASSSTYGTSAIKSVVDTWANNKFTDQLKTVDGYSARLITLDELTSDLGYEQDPAVATIFRANAVNTPNWVYSSDYWYWTMSPYNDSSSSVWRMNSDGNLSDYLVDTDTGAVRPVINVYKSKISS